MKTKAKSLGKHLKNRSFRVILTASFILISIIPLVVLQGISNASVRSSLQANMTRLSSIALEQARNNMSLLLEAYEDILYQLYTNDDLIAYVDNIENKIDIALNTNQLNRILTQMTYAKDYIESVTIITMSGAALFSDKLRGSSVTSSWLDVYDMPPGEILAYGMEDYQTKLLPTQLAAQETANAAPLFHMVHRIIDHKNVNREIGVVVLSINEQMLQAINLEDQLGSFYFIVDEDGRVISYPDKRQIGLQLSAYGLGKDEDLSAAITDFLAENDALTESVSIAASSPVQGWQVIGVMDQSSFYEEIRQQERTLLFAGLAIIAGTGLLIYLVSSMLARSMRRLETAMRNAQAGNLTEQINPDSAFSREMQTIAGTYNSMIHRIHTLLVETKEASSRQRNAEIKVLEAQINPHFLYNTLDSINWIAIDNDQFEISGMITALARILRYSIDNSNGVVPLRDEIDWLQQYVKLQQIRYKDSFAFTLDVDEGLLCCPIHKLLFQPFIENAIVHAFSAEAVGQTLFVSIQKEAGAGMKIRIADNGKGMDTSGFAEGIPPEREGHIGIANAIGRIRMYYGDETEIQVSSACGQGTEIVILLGNDEEGKAP